MIKKQKYASKKTSFGVLAFCIGIMAAIVAQGIKADREDAEQRAKEEAAQKQREAVEAAIAGAAEKAETSETVESAEKENEGE